MSEQKKGWLLKVAVLSISIMMISPPAINGILPEIRDYLGITQAQSELLTTVPSLATMFSVLASSQITVKIGMKNSTLIGLVLAGLAGIFPAFTSSYVAILISRAFFGIGLGLFKSLAVRYITLLFEPHERAQLMGYRSAFEQGGQSFLAAGAGVLFMISWNASFLIYAVPLFIAALFYFVVPDVRVSQQPKTDQLGSRVEKETLPFSAYLLAAFATFIVLVGASIAIRFPAMAAEVRGDGYNSSYLFAIKPIVGIVAGALFGRIYHKIGKALLYVGILGLAGATLLIGFSNGSFILLIAGFFIAGIVPAWIMPFVMMTVSKRTSGQAQTRAMALIIAGIQLGVFLMTPTIQLLGRLRGSDALTAAYPLLTIALVGILLFIITFGQKLMKQPVQ
ncbi:MAG: MFS transporter [Turicibacter sp.]|nr:MFS transporter [Turicibacter sp.]